MYGSDFFLGNRYCKGDYSWGDKKDEGHRYIHSFRKNPRIFKEEHHWYPREFQLIGILADGLECNLNSLEDLASSEPKARLIATTAYPPLLGERSNLLEVCKDLEASATRPGFKRVASLTEGDALILTFPKLLEVSSPLPMPRCFTDVSGQRTHFGEDATVRSCLPYPLSPCSDQHYAFAQAEVDNEDAMTLPVVGDDDALLEFDDGMWRQRLLPIYDVCLNFLAPIHYSALAGALVFLNVCVLHNAVEDKSEEGFYLQVREMRVIKPGRRKRLE